MNFLHHLKSKQTSDTQKYRNISGQDAQAMSAGEEAIILDVRTQAEYEGGHIPNAKLLPVAEIEAGAAAILPDKNSTIIVYCRSGRRSAAAAQKLVSMGYTQVFDLGGLNNWPYGLVK